jgi:hypothetical protein
MTEGEKWLRVKNDLYPRMTGNVKHLDRGSPIDATAI